MDDDKIGERISELAIATNSTTVIKCIHELLKYRDQITIFGSHNLEGLIYILIEHRERTKFEQYDEFLIRFGMPCRRSALLELVVDPHRSVALDNKLRKTGTTDLSPRSVESYFRYLFTICRAARSDKVKGKLRRKSSRASICLLIFSNLVWLSGVFLLLGRNEDTS
jgi:hypothetical protein